MVETESRAVSYPGGSIGRMRPEEQAEQIAASQHGVLSRSQALAAGMRTGAIDTRLLSGRWRAVYPGVYVPRPVPDSWHQRLMGAVLWGGPTALASHRSAAALWHLDGIEERPIEISLKAGRRRRGVVTHRRARSDDPPVATRDGIPTTGIERTLLDLARIVSLHRAGIALDDALRQRLTTLDDLRALNQRLDSRRPGTGKLRRLLADRDQRSASMGSPLEVAVLRLLKQRGLPSPTVQFPIIEGGRTIARVDFAYPAARVAIEADGFRWHGGRERWVLDVRRENQLKLLGWTVLRFTWEDIHERPEMVASQVRTVLGRPAGATSSQPTL